MKIIHPENIDFQSIDNIIFDWGGVITNINYQNTVEEFKKIGLKNFHEYFTQQHQNDLFKEYEIGAITSIELRDRLRNDLDPWRTDEEIDKAWCAMLLDTPFANIELVQRVAQKFNIFLLSNTNEIHVNYYNARLKREFNINYPSLFKQVFYSHQVGKRKPNADVFQHVINEIGLIAQKTLFIDDTEMHIDAADNIGLQAFFLNNGYTIHDIFDNIIN